MTHQNPSSSPIGWLVSTAVVVAAIAAVMAGLATPAAASEGVTAAKLADDGWTCFAPPSRPNRVACFNPGVGRPFPNNPDPASAYHFLSFDRETGDYRRTGAPDPRRSLSRAAVRSRRRPVRVLRSSATTSASRQSTPEFRTTVRGAAGQNRGAPFP